MSNLNYQSSNSSLGSGPIFHLTINSPSRIVRSRQSPIHQSPSSPIHLSGSPERRSIIAALEHGNRTCLQNPNSSFECSLMPVSLSYTPNDRQKYDNSLTHEPSPKKPKTVTFLALPDLQHPSSTASNTSVASLPNSYLISLMNATLESNKVSPSSTSPISVLKSAPSLKPAPQLVESYLSFTPPPILESNSASAVPFKQSPPSTEYIASSNINAKLDMILSRLDEMQQTHHRLSAKLAKYKADEVYRYDRLSLSMLVLQAQLSNKSVRD